MDGGPVKTELTLPHVDLTPSQSARKCGTYAAGAGSSRMRDGDTDKIPSSALTPGGGMTRQKSRGSWLYAYEECPDLLDPPAEISRPMDYGGY